ncbi:MAG: hypothetical protein SFU99_18380 [Saprospiraceae bacterium]|nr:hypothetical protein [Saprospiraceae bacterium]
MDHSLQLANELVGLTYYVNDAPKRITFSVPTIVPNVQIYALCYNTGASSPWSWGFLRTDQTSFTYQFQNNGFIRLFAMLKPQVYASQFNNNIYSNIIDLGLGDGTGTDFDGVMGARVTVSFIPTTVSNVVPYRGTPTTLQGTVTDYLHTQGYLIDIHDAAFNNPSNYQAIQFQIDADDHNVLMIEQMVWIHLFDGNGNLLGVADTLDGTIVNNNCNINLGNGFQMMAFIQGQQNPNTTNQFTFAIGDPKTDAKVTITED